MICLGPWERYMVHNKLVDTELNFICDHPTRDGSELNEVEMEKVEKLNGGGWEAIWHKGRGVKWCDLGLCLHHCESWW